MKKSPGSVVYRFLKPAGGQKAQTAYAAFMTCGYSGSDVVAKIEGKEFAIIIGYNPPEPSVDRNGEAYSPVNPDGIYIGQSSEFHRQIVSRWSDRYSRFEGMPGVPKVILIVNLFDVIGLTPKEIVKDAGYILDASKNNLVSKILLAITELKLNLNDLRHIIGAWGIGGGRSDGVRRLVEGNKPSLLAFASNNCKKIVGFLPLADITARAECLKCCHIGDSGQQVLRRDALGKTILQLLVDQSTDSRILNTIKNRFNVNLTNVEVEGPFLNKPHDWELS